MVFHIRLGEKPAQQHGLTVDGGIGGGSAVDRDGLGGGGIFAGGGGGGKEASTETSGSVYKGGSPNGASGALHLKNSQTQAGTAGIGGGGGGGVYTYTYVNFHEKRTIILPSAGGAGLVVIRIHTDY